MKCQEYYKNPSRCKAFFHLNEILFKEGDLCIHIQWLAKNQTCQTWKCWYLVLMKPNAFSFCWIRDGKYL